MEKLSMIGHVKDTPRILKKTYNIKDEYLQPFVDLFVKNDFKKVYFLGSGTSHHVALVIRNIFVNLLKIEGIACIPTIFTNHEMINPSGSFKNEEICVIGFSQHGDSISTCEAVVRAKKEGFFTIGVSEQLNSVIETLTDAYCHLVCEEEEIGPETRGYTGTIYQFYIIALEIAKAKRIINENEYAKLDNDAKNLANDLTIAVQESIDWYNRNKAEFLTMKKSAIAGYGMNYPTALEARLKFFETYAKPCTGYEMEEQLHGPLRAYNKDNFAFYILSEGVEFTRGVEVVNYMRDVFTEHVFVVTSENIVVTNRDLKFSIKTNNLLSPILYVVPFQVLSALICEDVGIDTKVSPIQNRSVSSHYPTNQ